MGVKNLWKLLRPHGQEHVSVEGKRLAVDVSIWMHQLKYMPESQIVYIISKRILKLLCSGITPLFVFDGGVPALKKQTMALRRERAAQSKKCPECNKSTCEHSGFLNPGAIKKMDDEAIQRIQGHSFNWGEFSDDSEGDSGDGALCPGMESDQQDRSIFPEKMMDGNCRSYAGRACGARFKTVGDLYQNPLSTFAVEDLDGLTPSERLKKLVEMRQHRKLPMAVDVSTPDAFSMSQIENLKKRNLVSSLAKDLNGRKHTRVQSDWRYCVEYEREEETQMHACLSRSRGKGDAGVSAAKKEDGLEGLFGEAAGKKEVDVPQDQKRIKTEFLDKYRDIAARVSGQASVREGPRDLSLDSRSGGVKTGARASEWTVVFENEGAADRRVPRKEDSPERAGTDGGPRILSYKSCQFPQGQNYAFPKPSSAEDPSLRRQIDFINRTDLPNESVLRIQGLIRTILAIFNICFVDSPEETDSQCGYLFDKKVIDGVITEDNDMLIHGATVYKNFFSKNRDIAVYAFEDVSRGLSLSKKDMIKLSFLLGSDYTPGVFGIGVRRAFEKIETVADDDIAEIEAVYSHSNVVSIGGFENGCVSWARLERFLQQSGLSKERIDEISFFVRKLGP